MFIRKKLPNVTIEGEKLYFSVEMHKKSLNRHVEAFYLN